MICIGCDPGLKGAIAAIKDGYIITHLFDMPTISHGKSGKQMVSASGLLELFSTIITENKGEQFACFVEEVGTMPGQGISSAFNFGKGVGILEACITAKGIPLHMARPATWKKSLGYTADKEYIRSDIIRKWPSYADFFKRKLDTDRAEAVAMAMYLWKKEFA